ncbi:MAG TPA: diacylglycerol kinase family protein [Gammaproteobacteria bacterium]|nr:diacylglycerol kinase family protein [Gammaproteobacteria bacterium]
MSPCLLIINPHAGRGTGTRLGEAMAGHLRAAGLRCEARFTRAPQEATELAEAAARAAAPAVIVAGGDGSVFEAVNGLVRAGHHTTALGVIPIGTGNDFVKMLGIPRDWKAACDRIVASERRLVDIGRCNGRYFANGVGIGFDAQVALEANRLPFLHGTAVYAAALIKTLLLRYSTPTVRIEHDGGVREGKITLVAAANGRCYGGAFRIAPEARIDDGLLELAIADRLSRFGILRLVPHVLAGTHAGKPGVTMLRTRRLRVTSRTPLVVHADGEIIEQEATHVEVEILPRALAVLC